MFVLDIKILIALHKPYWVPKDNVYFPLHVGREGKKNIGFCGDNTGDNISIKNPNFCELTGLYWAWKNLNCEYIGLCHYRRYFAKRNKPFFWQKKESLIFKRADYEKLLFSYDVILPKPFKFGKESIREQYAKCHKVKDLGLLAESIQELYPEYLQAFNSVMSENKIYALNMFAMSKKNFDNYCSWLFPILFSLEQKVDLRGYDSYQARIFGFMSERLFNVWLKSQNFRIKEVPVLFLE